MKDWVEEQTKGGRYGNASDYIRDLIRRDQDRHSAVAELQRLIDEGMESGESGRTPDDVLAEARRRARAAAR
jgi:antitoxin ParD1/3/4